MAKTRNPQDATIRNAKASKRRDDKLELRVKRIEGLLNRIFPGWRRRT